jgi:hypothetical protein
MHRLAPPATFSADSKSFGWVADGEITLYSLSSGDVRQRLSPLPTMHGFALHPSRPWLAAFTNRDVILFDLDRGKRVVQLSLIPVRLALAGVRMNAC